MDCQDAQEKLLESFDGALSPDDSRQLERHLAACPNCAEFADLLNALDLQLKEAITAPRLSPGFRAALQTRIDRHPQRLWMHWLPDVAYLAGSGAAILWCAVLLPFPASAVLWIGALIAAISYSFQALLFSSLEEL
jgi:anti-sigma factor (TIGR02949 family)